MKAFSLVTLFVAVGLLGACASHPSAANSESPKEYKGFVLEKTYEPYPGMKIAEYVHKKSGLKVLLAPQPNSEVVAYVTAYNVGSRFEAKGKTGLAHLFEHLMFRGTESFPQPFETLSSWGNTFNAYTSRDMTVYYQVVPTEIIGQVAKFESERMRKLLITPQGFQQERGAVVSERKLRTEDSPFGRVTWELYLLAFKEHPYRSGPIGFQKDLDAFSFEDALDFYQKFYAPNRAVLTIVGGFNSKEMLEVLHKNYGEFESVDVKEPTRVVEAPIKGVRRKTIRLKTEQPIIADSTRGLTYGDPDAAAEMLMCVLLADSDIGYLGNTLMVRGVVQNVGASCSPSIEPGLNMISLTGTPKMSVQKLEKEYTKGLGGFEKWLTKERVENLKLYFIGSQLESLRDPADLAESLASSYIATSDPLSSIEFVKKIQSVTYEDVIRRYKTREASGKARILIQPAKSSDPITGS